MIFRALWAFRGFILGSVKREFQSKYNNSLLGAAWNILNPLAMMLVYTVIFTEVMKARLPNVSNTFGYSIYLCAGLFVWNLFAEVVSRAQNVFIENANLLKKLNFPRLCLPTVIVLSSMVNFAIVFVLFLLFLLFSGNFPGMAFLGIFPLLIILIAFAIGLGITLGVLNVFFRDVGQFFGIFLTFWFWLTPIVYPVQALGERFKPILAWNPMVGLVGAFQQIFLTGQWPEWGRLWPITLLAVVMCTVGMWMFRRHSGEMVDEL